MSLLGETKECLHCKKILDGIFFEIKKDTGRRRNVCKKCLSVQKKSALERSPERIRKLIDRRKAYDNSAERVQLRKDKRKDPDFIKRNRAYMSEYVKTYAKKPGVRERMRENCRRHYQKKKNNINFVLKNRIGPSIRRYLREAKNNRKSVELLGYSYDQLRAHLEAQFVKKMGWHNMSEWNIDHIVPVSAFDFSTDIDEKIKICWGLANLRPVWAAENFSKKDKRIFLL